ncbi:MAG: RimK family alpha-L-glutamate ligase [Spirosomataceae bacterium]
MKKIGLVTCERLPQLIEADQQIIPFFSELGIDAEPVIWDNPDVNWSRFDALIIRNTWDYFVKADAFQAWLTRIENWGIPLWNSVDTIRRNAHKFYLQSFEQQGVPIIPTLFSPKGETAVSWEQLKEKGWTEIVVKPAISAGSYETHRLNIAEINEKDWATLVGETDQLIQPFLPEIMSDGEYSLIYFNKKLSHAIKKLPKAGDFRVQRQYGGQYAPFLPSLAHLEAAEAVLAQFPESLLYARVDGVFMQGDFYLMEIELIEPDLYFEFGEQFARNFTQAAHTLIH